jgi:hypothetical protein
MSSRNARHCDERSSEKGKPQITQASLILLSLSAVI